MELKVKIHNSPHPDIQDGDVGEVTEIVKEGFIVKFTKEFFYYPSNTTRLDTREIFFPIQCAEIIKSSAET